MDILKNFTVFEGCDGSGTTTQLNMLEGLFSRNGFSPPPYHRTFEPTNGSIGKLIRSVLRKEILMRPETVALLFAADRNEHIYGPGGIKERCESGELVICDRYLLSSLVYQGLTCGEELPALLNKGFPGPELLLFFDIDPENAQNRINGRGQREIFEEQDFQIKVRERYKTFLPQLSAQGVKVQTIDASLSPEEVSGEVWRALKNMPIFKG